MSLNWLNLEELSVLRSIDLNNAAGVHLACATCSTSFELMIRITFMIRIRTMVRFWFVGRISDRLKIVEVEVKIRVRVGILIRIRV